VPAATAEQPARPSGRERISLRERLGPRRAELEETALARVLAIDDPRQVGDPAYVEGFRPAVTAATAFALRVLERGSESPPPVPSLLLDQARHAARCGVGLDTVLRRYFCGYLLFADLLVAESASASVGHEELQALIGEQALVFDRLIDAISVAFQGALQERSASVEAQRLRQINRLLLGETSDASAVGYELEQTHVALVGSGERWPNRLRALAGELDRRLLIVSAAAGVVWAWLGGRRPIDPDAVRGAIGDPSSEEPLTIGESDSGVAGWRLSHQQALAAHAVAVRSEAGVVRYRDVALLASAIHDEVLIRSLRKLYLDPLAGERDGGASLRRTLVAFFATGRNASSTAAALGVHRHTVNSRLRLAEERIGHPLESRAAQVELALQLNPDS
jgi:hypothetical protein